jgi:hypothetical protein
MNLTLNNRMHAALAGCYPDAENKLPSAVNMGNVHVVNFAITRNEHF